VADEFGNISSYQDLVEAVVGTLARGDISVEARTWIAATELELFRDCDVAEGDQKLTGTIAASATSIPLPRGYISLNHIQIDGTTLTYLKVATMDQITLYREGDQSGVPKFYCRFGQTLELAPVNNGSAGTPYTMWYYGLPVPISNDNPSNELSELGWDAYLYGALMHSSPYVGDDERIPMWEGLYRSKKSSLQKAYWRSRLSGPLEQRPDFVVNDRHAEN
jgi:hypothetical protein